MLEAGFAVHMDSAGTGGWHAGDLPDPRSRAVAAAHGITLTHRARQLRPADFLEFDYILAMDTDNLHNAQQISPPNSRAKLHLMGGFGPRAKAIHVPDPYYGGPRDFEAVWDLLEGLSLEFVAHLQQQRITLK